MRFGDTILFERAKDGGPKSRVDGFWFFRSKKLGTLAVLKFAEGTREAYHTHAFDAVSWLLNGVLMEETLIEGGLQHDVYVPSLKPIYTPKTRFHKVRSFGTSWVLTFRGPWVDFWKERNEEGAFVTLTHNRVIVDTCEGAL